MIVTIFINPNKTATSFFKLDGLYSLVTNKKLNFKLSVLEIIIVSLYIQDFSVKRRIK